ncbi:MAG: cytochrome c [Defluviimonas sp.]|uniref:c-type cytochrome n=1 Tax=Albidovulum sp. TaxID=1872424 RepID=UPI002A2E45C3|nr:cytochrome c [Defluviimonas sp.]
MRKAIFALTTTLLAAMPALAQDMTNPDEILTARHGYMLLLAMQLAPLGAMAKGTAPYDAAAATEAAKNLAALSGIDSSMLWVPGTEAGVLTDSSALPAIIANTADRADRFAQLKGAADALVTVAGNDVEAMKAGLGGVGAACGGCHKEYRKPD